MKRLFLIFCLVVLCSCNQEPIDGTCDPPAISGLLFHPQGGIDTATSYGGYYYFYFSGAFTGVESGELCEVKPEKVECPWFSAVKTNDSKILVSVKQNDTEIRSATVNIKENSEGECGKYSASFKIIQCSPDSIKVSKEELLFSAEGGIDSITVSNNNSFQSYFGYDGLYIPYSFHLPYVIESSWFTIRVLDREKIIFSISKNETGEERYLIAKFKPCASSEVKITQSAE
ncbi:MAG: hypothetical protein LBC64_05905 [Fibromonadaceae bacterium]|jgi:hypothetical protein|nr:hypothetical protein [Fibromonadaceae bacterium]